MNIEGVWKPVKGYEGIYEVSNLGEVRSLDRMRKNGKGSYLQKGSMLKQTNTSTGYKKVELYKYGVRKPFKVHRLVAAMFIPNPSNKPYVNHIDGNPLNNKVDNLEWCTQKENVDHYVKLANKSIANSDRDIKMLIENGFTNSEILEKLNISRSALDYRLKMFNITNRNKGKYKVNETQVKRMLKDGYSVTEIARFYNCTQSNISHFMRKNNIRRRDVKC